jgi:Fe-coproporphyrin III synthase
MRSATARTVAEELLLVSGGASLLFHGNSLLPLLRNGDTLDVRGASWDEVHPGDLVVYRYEDKYPALRVARKLEDKVFLTADNWPGYVVEAWPEDLLGIVEARVRGGARLGCESTEWRRSARAALARYRARTAVASTKRFATRILGRVGADVQALASGLLGMPAALHVNISSVCNLACRMCPYLPVHKDEQYLNFMSRETFETLLPAIRRVGAVHLSGSGETLFNRDLVYFIERVRTVAPAARVSLTTNGTQLTTRHATEFVRLGVDEIHVSIDGARAATIESIRVGIDASRVFENLRRLAASKRANGAARPVVVANYVVGYGTYDEIEEFLSQAKSVGVAKVQLLDLQPATPEDARSGLAASLESDGGRTIRRAIQRAARLGIELVLHSTPKNACHHPYTPHVSESGEVFACCFLDYDGRHLHANGRDVVLPAVSQGRVNEGGFRSVWNSPDYFRFRRRNSRGDFLPYCRACYDVRADSAARLVQIVGPRPPRL